MKKRIIAIALLFSLAIGLLACGDNGNSNEKILSVRVGPDTETMDPSLNITTDGATTMQHLFEGLLVFDQDMKLQAGQAEKWETSEDGLTWTFNLRDGLLWSDGSSVTAKDFEYSWKRVCDPKTASPYAETVLGMVKGFKEASAGNLDALGVKATDDKTLVVSLESPCAYFGSLVASMTLAPVQKTTIDANGDSWATKAESYVSNGAFYMKEWVPGSHILLMKNPNYRDADSIKLDGIKFCLISSSNSAYSAYQNGELHFSNTFPSEELSSFRDSSEFHQYPVLRTSYLIFNTQREPLNNPDIRKALSLAIDREYICETLSFGLSLPAYSLTGSGWSIDGKDFGNKELIKKDYNSNLEEAKKLLSKAGYPDGSGFPQISIAVYNAEKGLAEYFQQAWKDLGIDVKVEISEWNSFVSTRRNGSFDIANATWIGDYEDPSNILDLFYSTNGNNDGRYNNSAFDEQINISRSSFDQDVRRIALEKAEKILIDDAGCAPFMFGNDNCLVSDKITGVVHSPYGLFNFKYVEIK